MAREYFCCYHSYLEVMEQLNDTERGRLFTACLTYSKTGEAPELRGNERFVFPAFRSQIDRDNANYEETCRKRVKSANARWSANDANASKSIPDYANDAKEKEKEKTKTKAKTKDIKSPYPLFSRMAELVPDGVLGSVLRTKLDEWMTYKHQRREDYTEQGLTALVSRLQKAQAEFGEDGVCDLITECMASNWQGIIFDKLSDRKAGDARRPAAGNAGKVQSGYYGGQTGASDWSRAAVARMMETGGDPA